jgi:hypothetical protein
MNNDKASFSLKNIASSVDIILMANSLHIVEFLENHKGLDKTAGVYVFWWTGDDIRFRESIKRGD